MESKIKIKDPADEPRPRRESPKKRQQIRYPNHDEEAVTYYPNKSNGKAKKKEKKAA